MKCTLLPALALGLTGSALAQVTPIGPFVGDRSESFETQNHSGFQPCIVGRVFNGTADLCTTNGNASMNITSGWSFRCSIQPYAGNRFTASAGPPVVFTFDTDVAAFGGYMGTNSWNPGQMETVTVRFYNRQGGLIDTVLANITDDCTWTWNGWSAPGIASVEIENSAFSGGFVDLDALEVLDSVGIGATHCNSNPNSTGNEAQLMASGSASAAANDLMLSASDLPQNAFGFFVTSRTPATVPNPGGSQGVLCLGGTIGRYVGPGQIQNSGTTGAISLAVDLTTLPQPNGPVAAMVGDTWYFQSWFRDSTPGGPATSNFSSGLEVAITP